MKGNVQQVWLKSMRLAVGLSLEPTTPAYAAAAQPDFTTSPYLSLSLPLSPYLSPTFTHPTFTLSSALAAISAPKSHDLRADARSQVSWLRASLRSA